VPRTGDQTVGQPSSSKSACGIRTAASTSGSLPELVAELKSGLGNGDFQQLVVFFSIDRDADALSSGEIAPGGMTEGGVLVIAFPRDGFVVHRGLVENAIDFGVERATEVARRLKSQIKTPADTSRRDHVFALLLVDGLSNAEESIVAAVHWAIDDVQLIGGSAGDGLEFHKTSLIYDGRVIQRSAVLLVIETDTPFYMFKTQNFEPTPIKLVVTAADTENRIVTELNAEPAALEYAAAIGLRPDDLGPFSFASYPLVVKVGGDYFCRSIRNMNPDGSLSFFCAIDEGIVFTVARPQDMLTSTAQALAEADRILGGVDCVIGFDCILRRLDAENRQIRHQVEQLYRKHNLVGFHTYGEQFNAMHLNQTLTGIAFGSGVRR
jgi:hypothetical protein